MSVLAIPTPVDLVKRRWTTPEPLQRDSDTFRQVDLLYGQMLWYAWGQIDAKVQDGLDLDDGWRIAECVGHERQMYAQQHTFSAQSVLGAWGDYLRMKRGELKACGEPFTPHTGGQDRTCLFASVSADGGPCTLHTRLRERHVRAVRA